VAEGGGALGCGSPVPAVGVGVSGGYVCAAR